MKKIPINEAQRVASKFDLDVNCKACGSQDTRLIKSDADIVKQNIQVLVARFADKLQAKLLNAEKKYQHGNAWMKDDWRDELIKQLQAHIVKGDPLDVAAYCAFAWYHQWSISDEAKP